MIDDEDMFNLAEACGQAFGLLLGSALAEHETLKTKAGRKDWAQSLNDLCKDERFSPQVSIVVGGIVYGLARHLLAHPDDEELV